ncbi:hypothetical protein CRENBAI_006140 [Crenichthys baileyi]|uniref:Uncharacterized protein n=1 Tax=Crenichthys baileyi TaxID=28760 RepID=A0AAV9RMX3_9TELE
MLTSTKNTASVSEATVTFQKNTFEGCNSPQYNALKTGQVMGNEHSVIRKEENLSESCWKSRFGEKGTCMCMGILRHYSISVFTDGTEGTVPSKSVCNPSTFLHFFT